jgi:HAMP domain-containing protein
VEDIEGELINIVYLHVPLPPETYAWNALKEIFYYGVAIALALAFLMALLVSRTISKPIKRLSKGAAALSRGNLDYQVQVSTNDEVGDLARTFIEMRQRLGQTLEELHQRAKTIEEKNIALDQSLAEISRMREFTEDILRSIDGGVITLNLSGSITKINAAARRILCIPEEAPESACLRYIPCTLLNSAMQVLEGGKALDRWRCRWNPIRDRRTDRSERVLLESASTSLRGGNVLRHDPSADAEGANPTPGTTGRPGYANRGHRP